MMLTLLKVPNAQFSTLLRGAAAGVTGASGVKIRPISSVSRSPSDSKTKYN